MQTHLFFSRTASDTISHPWIPDTREAKMFNSWELNGAITEKMGYEKIPS